MTAPDWTGEHAPGQLPAAPTAGSNNLRDRIDHTIRGPILIGLEDPPGTERATEWANHLVTWVMAVV